jgi:hypothetical protein
MREEREKVMCVNAIERNGSEHKVKAAFTKLCAIIVIAGIT